MAGAWRLRTVCVSLCAALLAVCASALAPSSRCAEEAEEAAPWQTDRAAAAAEARRQGKLLLVVHLSGDFAENSPTAREALVYRKLALADPRVASLIAGRFVVLCQHVGEAASCLQLPPPRKGNDESAERLEYAINYVCLPDERVLHFVPGFVNSEELLKELAFAEQTYAEMLAVSSAEQPLALRRAHLAASGKDDLAVFERLFPSRWKDDALPGGVSTVDLPSAFGAAKTTFQRSLTVRLGAAWSRAEAPALLAALAAHGGLAGEMSHLVLAEFPLLTLADLARPAYEEITGVRFWSVTERRESLANWWTAAVAAGRPILIVVEDDPYFAANMTPIGFEWPPKNANLLPTLDRFAAQVVTLDELAALATDAKLAPITYKHSEPPPRFLLFDGSGTFARRLPRNSGTTRLAQAMHAVLNPGVLEASARALGGTSDEEE